MTILSVDLNFHNFPLLFEENIMDIARRLNISGIGGLFLDLCFTTFVHSSDRVIGKAKFIVIHFSINLMIFAQLFQFCRLYGHHLIKS